jgi:molybdate transport system ATP-binding protein
VRDTLRIPCLYVTHNTGEAAAVAAEAILLRRGALVRQGKTAAVLREMMASSVDPDARVDNVVAGFLEMGAAGDEKAVLHAGPARLVVPAGEPPEAGVQAIYAVSPDDILVATQPPERVSARNVLAGEVLAVDPSPDGVWIGASAAGLEWTIRLTRSAAEELGLAPGSRIWLIIKTHAFRRLR